jgi:hypothetical protein
MKIRTSDGTILDNFENLQSIVEKIQKTEIIQKVARKEANDTVTYGKHKIGIGDTKKLTAQISNLLKEMSLCQWKGKLYCGNDDIFFSDFARHLNFLLVWLCSIGKRQNRAGTVSVTIGASEMKKALKWLIPIMKRVKVNASEDVACVQNLINSL